MGRWQITKGSSVPFNAPVVDTNNNPITLQGTETLAGIVWPGGDQPRSFALTPVFDSLPGNNTITTVSASDVAALDSATYFVSLTIDFGAGLGPQEYYRGTLEVQADAASATAPPVYCTIDDLRLYAEWIDDLQSVHTETGFLQQRGQARKWLDEIIVANYKYLNFNLQLGQAGFGSLAMMVGNRDPIPSKWLRDQLANDVVITNGVYSGTGLIVRESTVEIVAKRALYLICSAQLGRQGDTSYQDMARRFQRESESMVMCYRPEIYPTSNGYAGLMVNCGGTNLR